LRRLSARELLKLIQDTVDDQMERIKDIGSGFTRRFIHERYNTYKI